MLLNTGESLYSTLYHLLLFLLMLSGVTAEDGKELLP